MARLINSTAMTVDGVMEVADWFVAEGDHDDASRALIEGDVAMLTGRPTFEGFLGYWPQQTGPWADLINPMPKFVASRGELGPLEWNATAVEGDAVAGVRRLKAEREGGLFLSGCGELARQLIQAGLVDELYFGSIHGSRAPASVRTRRRRSRCGLSRPGNSTRASPSSIRTPDCHR